MTTRVGPVEGPRAVRALPPGTRIRLDPRVVLWSEGAVLIGGSPWRVSRLAPATRRIVRRLESCGDQGLSGSTPQELAVFRELIDRGFAHPLPGVHASRARCTVVVPAMDRVASLDRCLESVLGQDVVVVDDGSVDPGAVASCAAGWGARVEAHPFNRGPAAARNTGLAATTAEFVAFLDSDCVAPPGWPLSMLHHFEDPAVAAVAPRVGPTGPFGSVIERYEATRSSLDMGRHPELVRPGSKLGFVPTAALIVRREALLGSGFDEELRLGEDVDLVWRLAEAGWHVRYDPSQVVGHEVRTNPRQWMTRRFEYGTSAADLEQRHPGNLTPARVSAWNVAALGLLSAGRPVTAVAVTGAAASALARQLGDLPAAPALAARIVAQGVVADAAGLGHLLRREWWPIGAVALGLAPRSRLARTAAACMLAPIAWEWATQRPSLDPARYAALRLLDDATYGTGVISSCVRTSTLAPLTPAVRLPGLPSFLKRRHARSQAPSADEGRNPAEGLR